MILQQKVRKCKCVACLDFTIIAVSLVPIGLPIVIGGVVLGLISMLKESYRKYKVECLFCELDPKFKEYKEKKDKAEEKVDYWKGYISKAKYVERNDKSNNQKNYS